MGFDVSVVIVTHNRPLSCKRVINSLLSQTVLPLEIIVIDDASLKPFQFHHPLVKIFRNQSEIGLSASRNVGVKISNGDIVAFIDDDAIADVNWIKNIKRTFHEKNADVVGGPVLPLFLSKPPEWFDIKQLGWCVGLAQDAIIGCNFAVKRSVFEKIGYFNEELGRRHGKLLSREESEFLQRARYANLNIVFSSKVVVYHIIHPYRLTLHYLMRRMWWEGVSEYYCLLTLPSTLFHKTLLKTSLKKLGSMIYLVLKTSLSPKNKERWLLMFMSHAGFFLTLLKRST